MMFASLIIEEVGTDMTHFVQSHQKHYLVMHVSISNINHRATVQMPRTSLFTAQF